MLAKKQQEELKEHNAQLEKEFPALASIQESCMKPLVDKDKKKKKKKQRKKQKKRAKTHGGKHCSYHSQSKSNEKESMKDDKSQPSIEMSTDSINALLQQSPLEKNADHQSSNDNGDDPIDASSTSNSRSSNGDSSGQGSTAPTSQSRSSSATPRRNRDNSNGNGRDHLNEDEGSPNGPRRHNLSDRNLNPCNFNNPGNLCYMIAGLQFLLGTQSFCRKVVLLRYEIYEYNSRLRCLVTDEFLTILCRGGSSLLSGFNHFKYQNIAVFRRRLVAFFRNRDMIEKANMYEGDDQQDAHEFILDLLYAITKEHVRSHPTRTEDQDLFGLHHHTLSQYHCIGSCGYKWENSDHTELQPTFIPVQVREGVPVQEEYEEYFNYRPIQNMICRECELSEREEVMEGEDTHIIEARLKLVQVGDAIFIQQKRYSYNQASGKWDKNSNEVAYENDLVLNGTKYAFKAAIFHSGSSLESGHYWATRVAFAMDPNIKFICNDQYPIKLIRGELNHVLQKSTYLLSYEKKSLSRKELGIDHMQIQFLLELSQSQISTWSILPIQPTDLTIIRANELNADKPFSTYNTYNMMRKMIDYEPSASKAKAINALQQYTNVRSQELEKNGKNLPKEVLEDELKMSVYRRRRHMATQENDLDTSFKDGQKLVKKHTKNPEAAKKYANEQMQKIINPYNNLSKASSNDTQLSKEELIKKLEDPDTNYALELAKDVERNQSRRDLRKEDAVNNKKLLNKQSKEMRQMYKANANLERQKNEEIQKRKVLEQRVAKLEAVMNARMQESSQTSSRSKQVTETRVVKKRPKHIVPQSLDPAVHETLDSCRLSLPDLDSKKTSSKKKWKAKVIAPRPQLKGSKPAIRKTSIKRRKLESNLPEPRTLHFDDTKGRKKQLKLPKSYQQQRKWVKSLETDFMEERYDSDNSLVKAVKRSSSITRRPHNPFKKKHPKEHVKLEKKQKHVEQEQDHQRRRVQKRQREEIIIVDDSSSDEDTSSDESEDNDKQHKPFIGSCSIQYPMPVEKSASLLNEEKSLIPSYLLPISMTLLPECNKEMSSDQVEICTVVSQEDDSSICPPPINTATDCDDDSVTDYIWENVLKVDRETAKNLESDEDTLIDDDTNPEEGQDNSDEHVPSQDEEEQEDEDEDDDMSLDSTEHRLRGEIDASTDCDGFKMNIILTRTSYMQARILLCREDDLDLISDPLKKNIVIARRMVQEFIKGGFQQIYGSACRVYPPDPKTTLYQLIDKFSVKKGSGYKVNKQVPESVVGQEILLCVGPLEIAMWSRSVDVPNDQELTDEDNSQNITIVNFVKALQLLGYSGAELNPKCVSTKRKLSSLVVSNSVTSL